MHGGVVAPLRCQIPNPTPRRPKHIIDLQTAHCTATLGLMVRPPRNITETCQKRQTFRRSHAASLSLPPAFFALPPTLVSSNAPLAQPRKNAKELLAKKEARNRRRIAAIVVQAHMRGRLARGRANIVRRYIYTKCTHMDNIGAAEVNQSNN